MSCGNSRNSKTCRNKSCQRFYNNNPQPIAVSSDVQLVIAGNRVVDTGISIETEPQNYITLKTGLYHFAGDVVIDATAVGDVRFSIYMDGVELPCTVREKTLAVGMNEIHTETDLELSGCCCDVTHSFTYRLRTDTTATGNVVELCTGVLKLA